MHQSESMLFTANSVDLGLGIYLCNITSSFFYKLHVALMLNVFWENWRIACSRTCGAQSHGCIALGCVVLPGAGGAA